MDKLTQPFFELYDSIKNTNLMSFTNRVLSFIGLSFDKSENPIVNSFDNFFKILIGIYIVFIIINIKNTSLKQSFSRFILFFIGIFLFRSFIIFLVTDYKPPTNIKKNNIIHEVILKDLAFEPMELKIKKNDIVRFINKDNVRHSLTFEDERIDNTPILKSGDSFMIRFKEVDNYEYKTIYTETSGLGSIVVEE